MNEYCCDDTTLFMFRFIDFDDNFDDGGSKRDVDDDDNDYDNGYVCFLFVEFISVCK